MPGHTGDPRPAMTAVGPPGADPPPLELFAPEPFAGHSPDAEPGAPALDRIGWALATGAGTGAAVIGLIAWGSGASPTTAGLAMLAAAMMCAALIVLVGGPAWWLAGRIGRRGPVIAGATGAGAAALMALALLARPDGSWAGVAAMTALAASMGLLTALAMWLVAYPDG